MSKLKNVRVLTVSAMLVALAMVLAYLRIPIANILEIRVDTIPIAVAGELFGPWIAGLVGVLSDVGGYLVKPTGAFFPGFTITALVNGVIFGVVLYNHKPTLVRCFVAELLHTIIGNMLLNSLWLSMLYGKGFTALITSRVAAQLIMLPIQTAILFGVLKVIEQVRLKQQIAE